ncbi:GNAT family N-acetyltransferase [Persicimonas caeni]|uniref:GNAT family N-acetyltransferase n=1 Tax=Persicimonas caeni TaxID=2292766 RepID=A0A4Y6Q0N8_PERCE|nr:GNAT family N-acetyltransferase [Persicimonas caeni]QDG53999.1 GNAT family N-acetyltransferase [Persicimonas caeni]QED35220.1 GNAT family N-acetyltransferase [Persicimonas caeni]
MDHATLQIDIKHYRDLTKDELYAIMVLRDLVFVVGQKITAVPEVDGRDPECEHAMLYDGEQLIGTARLFAGEDPVVVGRVAIHPERQRQGLGSVLMRAVQEHLGARHAELHAQAHLEEWYASLGWERFGEPFDEAEIPHVMMRWVPTR